MILTDVVELSKAEWNPKKKELKEAAAKAVALKDRYEAVTPLLEFSNRDEHVLLKRLQNRIKDLFNTSRAEILSKECSLPNELITADRKDALSLAARSPKIELSHVRDVADKLGFIVTPFAYLDKKSYQGEVLEIREAIKGFDSNLSPYFNIYVLTPVVYYSVENHIKSDADLPIYASPACSQAFMAIDISIPVFRTLSQNIDQIRDRTNQLAVGLNKANQEIQNLARRVTELQVQVEKQRREAVLQELRLKKMKEEMAAIQAQRDFLRYEPMMLAIPKNSSINGDTRAIVGPCWGPDFEDIVLTSLGFTQVPGQREALWEKSLDWQDNPVYRPTNRAIAGSYIYAPSHLQY